MKKYISILSIIIILFFNSCCKIKILNDEQLRISFVGYQFNEIDSFYIFTYHSNSNFQSLYDSSLVRVDSNFITFSSDTALLFNSLGFGINETNESKYDFIVKNIFDGKVTKISNINFEFSTYKTGCGFKKEYNSYISNINSFKQNDTIHLNENVVYIKK